eukprot:CAMPEP_0119363000 /NCGR_PEP_ID=MMETSP1334-20130426/9876_1 /TAXON_ID=127549 /ORGANISM="Calcidiscus leptoporus, Strain RCC1130" /LENGTH=31 /DNA_ID= /DNA_START= /DNA_END= /DNA_ORIENTATION=
MHPDAHACCGSTQCRAARKHMHRAGREGKRL